MWSMQQHSHAVHRENECLDIHKSVCACVNSFKREKYPISADSNEKGERRKEYYFTHWADTDDK